ncbi:flagellar motor switch protein FliM [Rhizobium sp. KVB221]|uniref:Flagellar motor switch protein FliM n=2 Tax=Rhizobium setariae TaxID=2801340 RepID=A0A936YM49_9HYPH|nr:flagellar motor switch protein FliM [Rhizobium setariae]
MNPKLLALLTGDMGSHETIGRICGDLGQVLTAFLPDMIAMETQLQFGFVYDGCETGFKNDLIADLDEYMVLVDGSLKNWCSDFTIACSTGAIVPMVECLMGGDPKTLIEAEGRPASRIELELAPLIIDKIASVVKSAVSAPGNFEPTLTKPYNSEDRAKPADDYVDMQAALIRVKVELYGLVSHFAVIIPQKTLLKTTVRTPAAASTGAKTGEGWTEQLQQQVRRSQVRVEARIQLTPLALGTIARLQPGDVIPFLDKEDPTVQVSANGRDLYTCEFGRAGEQYTVRVKDTATSEEILIRDILG